MLSAAKHLNTDVETLRFPVKRGETALRVTGLSDLTQYGRPPASIH